MKKKEKHYIVVCQFEYGDERCEQSLFVTTNKSFAQRYIKKFNDLHKKWFDYYKQFTEYQYGILVLKEEHYDKSDRWYMLKDFHRCYIEQIDFRK